MVAFDRVPYLMSGLGGLIRRQTFCGKQFAVHEPRSPIREYQFGQGVPIVLVCQLDRLPVSEEQKRWERPITRPRTWTRSSAGRRVTTLPPVRPDVVGRAGLGLDGDLWGRRRGRKTGRG